MLLMLIIMENIREERTLVVRREGDTKLELKYKTKINEFLPDCQPCVTFDLRSTSPTFVRYALTPVYMRGGAQRDQIDVKTIDIYI